MTTGGIGSGSGSFEQSPPTAESNTHALQKANSARGTAHGAANNCSVAAQFDALVYAFLGDENGGGDFGSQLRGVERGGSSF
jgi:hypothetical protein